MHVCREGFPEEEGLKDTPGGRVGTCLATIRVGGGGRENILFQVDEIVCGKLHKEKKHETFEKLKKKKKANVAGI